MITFATDWVTIIGIILGVILPVFANIVTTLETKAAVRASILAALSLVTSVLTQLDHALVVHQPFNVANAVVVGLGTFIVAVASAWGFWDPSKVSLFLREKVGVKPKV